MKGQSLLEDILRTLAQRGKAMSKTDLAFCFTHSRTTFNQAVNHLRDTCEVELVKGKLNQWAIGLPGQDFADAMKKINKTVSETMKRNHKKGMATRKAEEEAPPPDVAVARIKQNDDTTLIRFGKGWKTAHDGARKSTSNGYESSLALFNNV